MVDTLSQMKWNIVFWLKKKKIMGVVGVSENTLPPAVSHKLDIPTLFEEKPPSSPLVCYFVIVNVKSVFSFIGENK